MYNVRGKNFLLSYRDMLGGYMTYEGYIYIYIQDKILL